MKTMKKLLILSLILSVQSLYAQFPGMGGYGNKASKLEGKITGTLLDSISNEKIGYATIVLKKAGKEKEVNGILSDDDGSFKLDEVVVGKYDLFISFLGYEEKIIRAVELTEKKPDKNLNKILLTPSNYLLDEVEITAEKSLIETKVDKIVYNAENDASNAGGDATDVLRKVPLLVVDLNGNVSLRGSENVRILINGKPSGMFSQSVSDALKMFPADQISKVEVITSPGAKYDGEGTAGIVNIITKKGSVEGVAGSFDLSAGTRHHNGTVNLSAGKGRFGSSVSGSVYYSIPNEATSSLSRTSTGVNNFTMAQDGTTTTSRLGFNGTVSAFYDFNAFNAINSSFSYQGFGFDSDGFMDASIVLDTVMSEWRRENEGGNLFSGFDWSTDYTKKFEDNDGQELALAYQLSGNIQNQDYTTVQTGDPFFLRNENQFNDGDNRESTIQVDYTHPLKKGIKLEVGGKTVLRDITSDSKYNFYDDATKTYSILDEARSQIFNYGQDVYAGYGQLSFPLKKFQVITGLRYETTSIEGALEGDIDAFSQNYDNWLPNFTISRGLKNFQNIKFSYTQRIQRPSLFYINPFTNSVDQVNITVGNPALDPERTNQYELSYNTFIKGVGIFSSFYYKTTDDIIESIIRVDNGVSINSFDNVGQNQSLGLNIFSTKTLNNFTLRGGVNFFTYNAEGVVNGEMLTRDTYEYNVFFSGEYSITGSLKVDMFGFFRSPRRSLQGDQASFSMYGLGAKKEFNKWTLGIRLIEPFNETKFFDSRQEGSDFVQESSFGLPFRSFGLSLGYKFGNVDFKERKSKIKNDDLKSGEGGGGGGNMGGQNSRGN